jgi:alkylation response protein AidB-like acyl-CoA dehydrogenase
VDLVLSEEQELLARTAREFVNGRSSLQRIRRLRDTRDADGFSRELWGEMAALGWLGIVIPEEYGGAGLGWMELMVVLEELGRGLMPEPMLSTVLLGGSALLVGGSDAQKREHLPAIAGGTRLITVAHKERGSRFAASQVATRAEKSGSGFLLTGEKTPVPDGHVADWLIVSARTSGGERNAGGITLFALRADTPGVAVERLWRIDSRNAATVRLDDVRVGADAVIGTVDHGGALLARVADRGAIGLSAEMLGSMSAALEMTLEYLRTRVQFGALIGTFQGLKHRAAKMYMEMELARSAVMGAHRALDENRDEGTIARLASLAKARCTDAFNLIAKEGVQMHGGIGMTDEHDIGLFLKRARVAEMTFGDAAYHRDRYAKLEGY